MSLFGNKNKSFWTFILYFARFTLSLHGQKLGMVPFCVCVKSWNGAVLVIIKIVEWCKRDKCNKIFAKYANALAEPIVLHSSDLKIEGDKLFLPLYMAELL